MPTIDSVWGVHLLRFSLAALYLWFGFSQVFQGIEWVGYVPQWAVEFFNVPPPFIVLFNGSFEIIAGALLALNIVTRYAALALALHLVVIVFEFGLTATGVRDFAILMATVSLAIFAQNERRGDSAPQVIPA